MEWKYIAGFFDGEGSLIYNGKGFRITISQNNEDVLSSIKNFVGFGGIIYIPKRKAHWNDSWSYYIAKQTEVHDFIKHIKPFVIVKRDLIFKTIPKIEKIVNNQILKKNLYIYRKREAKKLRVQGLTYRAIGKKLKIDFGYVRRLVLDIKQQQIRK